jgi:hypothetical protein
VLTIITDPAQTPSTLTVSGPDAAVKHANQGVVTYQFSYAGDPLLTASSATFSVTVQPGNGNNS